MLGVFEEEQGGQYRWSRAREGESIEDKVKEVVRVEAVNIKSHQP